MVKNIWMSHISRCTELGYLSVGHISSNYHQHLKCTVLFVKHHYFHLSSFKKLLSSCWLIQVYIQFNFILQAFQASTKQKLKLCASLHKNLTENAETYYMQLWQPYSSMFPRHIHHISIPNTAMKWSSMSEKWAKKAHVSSPPKCSTQLFKNTHKLLYTPQWHFMSLNMGPLSCGDSILEWLLPEAKREKFNWKQRPVCSVWIL